MRVAFLTHYADLYGANRSLLNLIDGLRAYEVQPYVVAPEVGDLTKALEAQSVPFAVIAFDVWMAPPGIERGRWGRLLQNIRVFPRLLRQLRQWNTDIVYTNSSTIAIGHFAAKLLRKRSVWHIREFGALDFGLKPDWGEKALQSALSTADAQIAISEAIRSALLSQQDPRKVHLIYNGVASEAEFDRLHALARSRVQNPKRYTFALVGFIHPAKGQDTAIRAFAQVQHLHPDCELILVGSGTESFLKTCRTLATELGVEKNVVFTGHLANPNEIYSRTDAVLMCSRQEAMGRVTVEAMSNSLPVIGLNSGGTTEIIEHERTGLLYTGGVEELAACMMRFIENPGWARKLGDQGWQVARSRFNTEIYARQVHDVLQSVLI